MFAEMIIAELQKPIVRELRQTRDELQSEAFDKGMRAKRYRNPYPKQMYPNEYFVFKVGYIFARKHRKAY